jgi:RNase adaptor protein for sRNA GlmZ degradation
VSILKKLLGLAGTEEVIGRAADEIDKVSPGLSRKFLITIVAAAIGALTTWALTIDGRVYTMTGEMALRQTIEQERVLLGQLEQRFDSRVDEVNRDLAELRQKLDAIYCKLYDKECKFHGVNP